VTQRIVSITTVTPTATADTTDLVDATYPFLLQGGTAQQINAVREVMLTGQAAASAPTNMILAHDSTVCVTNSLSAEQTDFIYQGYGDTSANPPLTGNTNTTKPRRSALWHLLNLSINAYGGVILWQGSDRRCPTTIGAVASQGEISLSAYTGGSPGAIGAHMIYETL
jgi:hypothetical protein